MNALSPATGPKRLQETRVSRFAHVLIAFAFLVTTSLLRGDTIQIEGQGYGLTQWWRSVQVSSIRFKVDSPTPTAPDIKVFYSSDGVTRDEFLYFAQPQIWMLPGGLFVPEVEYEALLGVDQYTLMVLFGSEFDTAGELPIHDSARAKYLILVAGEFTSAFASNAQDIRVIPELKAVSAAFDPVNGGAKLVVSTRSVSLDNDVTVRAYWGTSGADPNPLSATPFHQWTLPKGLRSDAHVLKMPREKLTRSDPGAVGILFSLEDSPPLGFYPWNYDRLMRFELRNPIITFEDPQRDSPRVSSLRAC
jgi:hypothetical protein